MRGFIRKDLEILLLNKKYLAIVAVIFFMTIGIDSSPSFMQMYLPMMAVFLLMSTFSYDEYDNGMAFLMTLPVVRRTYVQEKYLFGCLFAGGCCIISAGLAVVLTLTGKASDSGLGEVGITFLTSILFIGIMMGLVFPLILKFGTEKGRMAMLVIFVAAFVGIMLLGKLRGILPFTIDSNALEAFLNSLGPVMITLAFLAVTAVVLLVSCFISIRIMEKKEF